MNFYSHLIALVVVFGCATELFVSARSKFGGHSYSGSGRKSSRQIARENAARNTTSQMPTEPQGVAGAQGALGPQGASGVEILENADNVISNSEAQRRRDSQFAPSNRCTVWFCLEDVANSARQNTVQQGFQQQGSQQGSQPQHRARLPWWQSYYG